MKKTLKGILCLILVLGMIPAAVISAFAQGKGVAKNDSPNHTIENAPNQYIPENIDIDGKRGDLGWKEYVNVDSVSGVWNTETVSDVKKQFSYEYSIRRDHEMLYVIVDFGGETVYDFDVYFSADDGKTVTTVSFSARNNNAIVAGADVDKTVVNGGIVEIGYRLTAKNEYVAADKTYKYFIGAKYDDATLFYPAVYPEFSSDYKKPDEDTTIWDDALEITYNNMLDGAESISEYVNIDGKFTESYWTHLTNFHMGLDDNLNSNDYKNGNYDLIDFDEVKFSDNHYFGGNDPESSTNAAHLKLKADVRMDKYSIFGAAFVQHSEADKKFDFRLYVKRKDAHNSTAYKIIATYDPSKNDVSYDVYYTLATTKDGETKYTSNKVPAAEHGISAIKIVKQNVGNVFAVEFRLDNNVLKRDTADGKATLPLDGNEFEASVFAECKHDCQNKTCFGSADSIAGHANHYISSIDAAKDGTATVGGAFDHAEFAWHFKYDEKKNDDLSDEIAIDGTIESSTFKSLLAHDRFLYGYKRPANYTAGNQSDCKQFAYTVHADYEYLYCAALVDLKDATYGNPLEWEPNKHAFNLYVNKNIHSGSEIGFDGGIKLYLADQDTVKIKLINPNGDKEVATEYTGNDIEAVIKSVKSLHTKNAGDTRYAIEFKVPLSLLGINHINDTTIEEGGSSAIAFVHAASVDDDLNANSGLAGPVPNFNAFAAGFKPAEADYWWTSLTYAAMTPAVMADGAHIEKIWTDAKDGSLIDWTEVNYTNATINPASDNAAALNALRNASFRYKIVPGRENLYCAAQIDPIDFNNIQFALWIKVGTHPIRFVLRNESGNAVNANLHAYWYETGDEYTIDRGYDDTLHKPYVKYSLNKVDGKYYVELIINYKYFGAYDKTKSTWEPVSKNDSFKFSYFVALEEYIVGNSKNEMLYPALASAFKGNVNAYATVASNWGDLTAKAATIEPLAHIAPETIKVDGNLTDPGWSEDQWVYVSALGNAVPQSRETIYVTNNNDTNFSFKYQLRHDDEYLYVGAVMYLPKEYSTKDSSKDSTGAFTKGGTQPEFRIWITPKDTINEVGDGPLSFKYLYDVHAKSGSQKLVLPQINGIDGLPVQDGLPNVEIIDGSKLNIPQSMSEQGYVTLKDGVIADAKITYPDMILRAAENWAYWYPNGGNAHVVTKNTLVYDMIYGDTTFYGTNDILQENTHYGTNNGDDWYANVDNISYSIANEHAYIGSGKDKTCGSEKLDEKTAVVEFKIKKSEFDPNNTGFEYCFTATVTGWYDPESKNNSAFTIKDGEKTKLKSMDYALHYPARYFEPGSTYAYNGLNFPYWNWVNALDFADIEEEAKLRNNTTPVVSLGAKVSNGYTKPDGELSAHAIRFGARYEEKYIRYLAGMDDGNYWDVKDMGLCIAPKVIVDNLSDGELTLETYQVKAIPADNIVNWKSGGGSNYGTTTNFADYENFVFYVTIWDVPEEQLNLDFSFRGYMTFYTGTYDNAGDIVIGTREEMNAETFYGNTIVRNFNEVQFVSESQLTEEELPDHDGDFGVEDFEGRD